jgi:hypothetical protein
MAVRKTPTDRAYARGWRKLTRVVPMAVILVAMVMACSIRVSPEVWSAIYNHREELIKIRAQPLVAAGKSARIMAESRIDHVAGRRLATTTATTTTTPAAATTATTPAAATTSTTHAATATTASATPADTTTAVIPSSPEPKNGAGIGESADDDMALEYIDGQYAYFPRDYQDDDIIEAMTPHAIEWPMIGGMGIVAITFLWATAYRLAPPNHKKQAVYE